MRFEYDDKSGGYVASYRGLTIKAEQDGDARNPWKDCDGFAPLIWTSGEGLQDDAGAEDLESPLSEFSAWHIGRKWRELVRILAPEYAPDIAAAEALEEHGRPAAEAKRAWLAERLADMRPSGFRSWGAACDYLEALESLWNLAGIPALDFQRNGYSQGDSVRGLLVATRAWQKAMGIPAGHDFAKDFEAQANVFGAYAFGDVYGYAIEDGEGEDLDSCWGYYGTDFDESGLAESAKEAADSILKRAAERRSSKLAELVRNRVPLEARPAILAEAGKLA